MRRDHSASGDRRVGAFVIGVYVSTSYEITAEELIVRFGPFRRRFQLASFAEAFPRTHRSAQPRVSRRHGTRSLSSSVVLPGRLQSPRLTRQNSSATSSNACRAWPGGAMSPRKTNRVEP